MHFTFLQKAILKNFEVDNEFVCVKIFSKGLRIELKKEDFDLPGKFITELYNRFKVEGIKKVSNIVTIELSSKK